MNDIPQLFTDKKDILSYDFDRTDAYIDGEINKYIYIKCL